MAPPDQPVSLAEELVTALVIHLLREGVIAETDLIAINEGLSEDARHLVGAMIVEAAAPGESDGRAQLRRERFRIVKE